MNEIMENKTMLEGTKRFKVLMLEDRETDAELMTNVLRKSGFEFDSQRVQSEAEYRHALEDHPDVILADFELPQFDVFRALGILKKSALDIPFIVVTGALGDNKANECIRAGADDYLLKDRLGRLGSAVKSALWERKLRKFTWSAELAAKSSDRQLQVTFGAIASPMFILDRDRLIVKCNQAAELRLEKSQSDMAGRTPCSMLGCTLEGQEQCPTRRMWESQRRETDDVMIDNRWYTASSDPIFDEQGALSGAVHIITDINERVRAEGKVRENEKRYRLLVETSPDAILVYQDGKIRFANTAGSRLTGTENPADLIGLSIIDFVHPDYRDLISQRMRRLTAGDNSLPPIEIKLVRGDGKSINAEMSSVASTYEGRPAVLVFMRDLSERRRLEAQLHQSQKMESLGRLAGGIAHDFNNLLTAIMANAELLLMKGGHGEKEASKLKIIVETSERASHLTRQLLAFSRNQEVESVPLDPSQIIKEMKKMFPSLVGEDIECRFDLVEGAMVKADPSMIEQIIMNLVVNARDAMPRGGLLAVSTRQVELDQKYADLHPEVVPGDYLMITTSDTGVGMPPDVQGRIFEPFFTTKGTKGTGLGLATVYGHVKKLGGHINCYSEVGRGTEFKIYLPTCRDIGIDGREAAPKSPDMPMGREKVLLVEDETVLRETVHLALEKLGYRVFAAADAEEARRLLKEAGGVVDVLLTDVIMPKERGDELAADLKQALPSLKVIFMSGYTPDRLSWDIFKEKEFNFLNKPFTLATLAGRVREVLDTSQAGEGSEPAMERQPAFPAVAGGTNIPGGHAPEEEPS